MIFRTAIYILIAAFSFGHNAALCLHRHQLESRRRRRYSRSHIGVWLSAEIQCHRRSRR